MNKNTTLAKPNTTAKISFDELYESFASDWEKRAEMLRLRRWKKLRTKRT